MTLRRLLGWCAAAVLLRPVMAAGEPGLLATFADGKQTVKIVVNAPAFALADNESVHPQVAPAFTATYEGSIKVLRRATYNFSCDGKISLDGKDVTGPVEL